MTPQEVRAAAASLRTVGGAYEYVAACVEHDNRPRDDAPLPGPPYTPFTTTDLAVVARFGLTPEIMADPSLIDDDTEENTLMTENRIVTIAVSEISGVPRPGSRAEYLVDLARSHPDRDEYGQLLEYVVTVPDVPGLFRGRYSPFALREAAERVAAGITGARVVASPLVTASRRTVMVVPSKACRPPKVGEPNHCTEHCSGPACFTQKAYPCCGLCTMHRMIGDPR